MVPILPESLADLVNKIGGQGSGSEVDARVWVRYDAHLPALSLWDGENSHSILSGAVLQSLHGAVIFKIWYLCGVCWEDCKLKCLHIPTP